MYWKHAFLVFWIIDKQVKQEKHDLPPQII